MLWPYKSGHYIPLETPYLVSRTILALLRETTVQKDTLTPHRYQNDSPLVDK